MEHSNNLPFAYMNEKSKKMGPRGVLTKEEDAAMITSLLTIQECGLSITLQQLKMKVVELT
jgi:hypothetical protein